MYKTEQGANELAGSKGRERPISRANLMHSHKALALQTKEALVRVLCNNALTEA